MDKKLLLDLFHLPSPSGQESNIQSFLKDWLNENKIAFKQDATGNIFNVSFKDRPLLSAHMDTVQDEDDVVMAPYININNGIVKGYGVIGGDDKCGIYTILDLLKNSEETFNFVFSVQEETGGIGASAFIKKHDLKDVLWGLALDRKGSGDILCFDHSYGTKEFEDALLATGKNFGFEVGHGSFCDADSLSEKISCANISVGYYNAHCKNEYVKISELQNSINFIHSLIKYLDVKFEAPEKKDYGIYGNYFDDYYPSESSLSSIEGYCELCGCQTSVNKISSLGMNLCVECEKDLLHELEEDIYYSDKY